MFAIHLMHTWTHWMHISTSQRWRRADRVVFLGRFKPGVPQKYLFLIQLIRVGVSQIIDTNKRHILNLKFKTTHLKGTVGYTPLWHFIFWSHILHFPAFFCTVCTVVLRFHVDYKIFAFGFPGKFWCAFIPSAQVFKIKCFIHFWRSLYNFHKLSRCIQCFHQSTL